MSASAETNTEVGDTLLVGRQAIFDRNMDVFAYELLYRDHKAAMSATVLDGDVCSSRTLVNALVEIGLDRLAGENRVFINFTEIFFTDMAPVPFDKERVVMEILEDIPVTDELVAGVKKLSEQGYSLALDDFQFESKWRPILPYMDFIKLEVNADTLPLVQAKIPALKNLKAKLLAEKVEDLMQFHQLHALGFDLFQGYFFSKPKVIEQKKLQNNHVVMLQLLSRLNDPAVDVDDLHELISQDSALSFKTLRFINSAGIGLTRKVESIRDAVVLIGINRIKSWASLMVMANMGEAPRELMNLGLLRANLCERMVRAEGKGSPEIAYTVGLLSTMDAMLSMPLDDVLGQLPLSDEVKTAIIQREGEYGETLASAQAIEENQWDKAKTRLSVDELYEIYLESSESAFRSMADLED